VVHRVRIQPVPVPDWTLHWPRCTCGWDGDIVRTRAYADAQEQEHLGEHTTTIHTVQDALF